MSKPFALSGALHAFVAAALFGASTPFSKLLLGHIDPILMAGLLYLGSGIGLFLWRMGNRGKMSGKEAGIAPSDLPWLAGAIGMGGVLGPILLMLGLQATPSSTAALLLNLEGVMTAALAWFVFRENCDQRIALGMGAIVAGGIVLSWSGRPELGVPWGPVAIIGACFTWAVDNNLTRKVSAADPVDLAAAKGLVAGCVNLGIALKLGAVIPAWQLVGGAALVGFLGYGVSLTQFVYALRHIGTARTGAYFSLAPFVGAGLSILLLGDPLTPAYLVAATFMGAGLWLHLTEDHDHEHTHDPISHDHLHHHDDHHQHAHTGSEPVTEPHAHFHLHAPQLHSHRPFPDIHHRHEHPPR